MTEFVVYDFRIDVWRPETLPMKRLSEYTRELARLFGSSDQVHLLKIRKGSAVPEIAVASSAQASVAERLRLVGTPGADAEIARPYLELNSFLRDDGGSAVLKIKGGARILDFPGCRTPLSEEIVIHESGTLDGMVIRVGGKDETVPVWLEGEHREKLPCISSRPVAKELAVHLFGEPVRVSGDGTWKRNSERVWELVTFSIKSWIPLDNLPLDDLVTKIRETPGNGWADLDDPMAAWRRIRGQD
ncbi:MAG: hypothetical protein ABI605_15020 [Rhizobacter sp.]